jgi:hypothetical protein
VRDLCHADVGISEHRLGSLDVVVREFWRTASGAADAPRGGEARLGALVQGSRLVILQGDGRLWTLRSLQAVLVYRGEYGRARTVAEQLQQIAHRIGDPAIVAVADRLMGNTLLTLGRPREAQQCLERVL